MSLDAFAAPGRFWKGNLHTHSTNSDGRLSPSDVCTAYRLKGYDFLCLSDHFLDRYDYPMTDTRPYRTENFTTLIGAELHGPDIEGGEKWHILAVGLPLDFDPLREGETGPQIARRAAEAGAFVVLPHPEWYGLTEADAASIPEAMAVEVYNHISELRVGRGGGAYFLDQLLVSGRRINAIAADDAHFFNPENRMSDAFGGWVMVKAEENTPEALLAALKAGHNYSTQGPDILDIRIEGEELVVESSAVAQITLAGHHSTSAQVWGRDLRQARLPLAQFKGGWGRVVLVDAAGRKAWSNPIWF